jgi:agmatinase
LDDVARADIAILGAPFDSATTFRPGARFGPAGIREASLLIRSFNEALAIAPFQVVQVADAGDCACSPVDVKAAHDAIQQAAAKLTQGGTRVLGLGGDHSVTLPLLRAAAAAHGPLSVLQFDSHMDTSDLNFGSPLTHGTVFRRAVEDGLIDPSSSLQVGLRGSLYSDADATSSADLGFATIFARELDQLGIDGILARIGRHTRAPLYVTVDIDVLDPAFAPGTGTPESGGLSSRELLAILRGLRTLDLLPVAGDVVEVAPAYDPAGITQIAAANVAFELVSLMALAHRAERS